MSITVVVERIRDYRNVYLEGMRKINEVYENTTMSDQGKQIKVKELMDRYTPMVDQAAERVLSAIEDTKSEIRTERQKGLVEGLANAEAVALVRKGIAAGDYSADMIKDLIKAYEGDEVMTTAIKAAVSVSDDPEIKALAMEIKTDQALKQIEGLDKAAERIKAAPKFAAKGMSGDLSVMFWQNGVGIDNLITFLLGLEKIEDITSEIISEPDQAVSDEDMSFIFTNKNTGIKFGEA